MKGRSFPFKGIIAYPPPVSRPDLLFFRFCFLFFTPRRRRESIFFIFMRSFMYIYAFCLPSPSRPAAVPPPPQGEASARAPVPAHWAARQGREKSLPHHKVSLFLRAYLGSPCGGAGAKRLRGEKTTKRKAPAFTGALGRPFGRVLAIV